MYKHVHRDENSQKMKEMISTLSDERAPAHNHVQIIKSLVRGVVASILDGITCFPSPNVTCTLSTPTGRCSALRPATSTSPRYPIAIRNISGL